MTQERQNQLKEILLQLNDSDSKIKAITWDMRDANESLSNHKQSLINNAIAELNCAILNLMEVIR